MDDGSDTTSSLDDALLCALPLDGTAEEASASAHAAAARAQIRSGHARDFLAGGRAAPLACRTGSTFSPLPASRMRSLDMYRSGGQAAGLEAVVAAPVFRKHVVVYDDNRLAQPDPHETGRWVFPLTDGFEPREYQLAIVRRALFENTLVSLPTGLGKTFISAVVMANYFRWFPSGQIVFLAPTKPLVTQQVEACHDAAGIPAHATAQLLGNIKPSVRAEMWAQRRLFFCTPQSFANDLSSGAVDPWRIVLVVFDEAHRASGGYAYCTAVQELDKHNRRYRVLALSATPGSDLSKVQDVITQLHIAHIEVRGDDDPDVQKYTYDKTIHEVTVPLSRELTEIRAQFISVMKAVVGRLVQQKVIPDRDPEKLPQVLLLQWKQELMRCRPPGMTGDGYHVAMSMLTLLISLSHALRVLLNMGSAGFFKALMDIQSTADRDPVRASFVNSRGWRALVDRLSFLHSNGRELIHPKILKLVEVLRDHFQRFTHSAGGSRCIVFTHARSTVDEILTHLKPLEPMCKASPFVGQAGPKAAPAAPKKQGKGKHSFEAVLAKYTRNRKDAEDDDAADDLFAEEFGDLDAEGKVSGVASKGQTQKQQQEVIDLFRSGAINVLVATCIGEEGLDIGSVDLVVFYDSVASPIRMMQRLGRTGRKRSGSCVCLCTAGTEVQKFRRALAQHRQISTSLRRDLASFQMYRGNPAMVWMPDGAAPKLEFETLNIGEFHASQLAGRTVGRLAKKKAKAALEWGITTSQQAVVEEVLAGGGEVHVPVNHCRESAASHFPVDLAKWPQCQTEPFPAVYIGHSSVTNLLVTMMRRCGDILVLGFDDARVGEGVAEDTAGGSPLPWSPVRDSPSPQAPAPVPALDSDEDFVAVPALGRDLAGSQCPPGSAPAGDTPSSLSPIALSACESAMAAVLAAARALSARMPPPPACSATTWLSSPVRWEEWAVPIPGAADSPVAIPDPAPNIASSASGSVCPRVDGGVAQVEPSPPPADEPPLATVITSTPCSLPPVVDVHSDDDDFLAAALDMEAQLTMGYAGVVQQPSAAGGPPATESVVVRSQGGAITPPPPPAPSCPGSGHMVGPSGGFDSTPPSLNASLLSPRGSVPGSSGVRKRRRVRRVVRRLAASPDLRSSSPDGPVRDAVPLSAEIVSSSSSEGSSSEGARKRRVKQAPTSRMPRRVSKYFELDAELSGSDSGDEEEDDDEVPGSLVDFIDDGTQSQSQPSSAGPHPLFSSPSQRRRSAPRHPMPLVARLMQAMQDGVTADDFAEDEEEEVMDVDAFDDGADEGESDDGGSGGEGGARGVRRRGGVLDTLTDGDSDDFD